MPITRLSFPTQRNKTIAATIGILACAVVFGMSGCRSNDRNDLYRQKLTSEIRVLEDQLYDADYENRVLRDKLARLEQSFPKASKTLAPQASPPPDRESDASDFDDFDMGDDFEAPLIDEGEPAEELPPPVNGRPSADPDDDMLLPPPGGPEPPSKDDLEIPPIVPGELLPPPRGDEEGDKPPGQIQLPDSIQAKTKPIPSKLRIHQGLSGGHRFDEEEQVDGMFLVINAVDSRGKTVDLSQFDIDAKLTVVALDPKLDPSEARIGRWEFTTQEIRGLIRSDPTSGLHIPVRWQQIKPSSEDVIVHVRLQAADEVMQCEGRLKIATAASVAQWMPRGQRR